MRRRDDVKHVDLITIHKVKKKSGYGNWDPEVNTLYNMSNLTCQINYNSKNRGREKSTKVKFFTFKLFKNRLTT